MRDKTFASLGEGTLNTFVYHMYCCRPYVLKDEHFTKTCTVEEPTEINLMSDDDQQPGTVRSGKKKHACLSQIFLVCA